MAVAHRCLYVEIRSVNGLSSTPKRPYAVVSVRDREKNLIFPKEKSKVGKDGGSGLEFKFMAIFYINVASARKNGLDLVVKLKSKRWVHSNDDIGVVRVPITELLEGFGDGTEDHEKQVTSKSIVTSEGTEEGTLEFSYKFGRILQEPPKELKKKFRRAKFKKAAKKLIRKLTIKGGFAAVIALLSELLQESVLDDLSGAAGPSDDDDDEEDE